MIEASLSEVVSLARGWLEAKARIRFIAFLASSVFCAECSVISVDNIEIGLKVSGQPRGIASVRLAGCSFSFGAEDIPESERALSKFRFDTGVSVVTVDGESLWLIEIIEGPTL